MPTYVYEAISPAPGAAERFEVRQGFDEPALTVHPTTGAPVRRVISGGLAVIPAAHHPTPPSRDADPRPASADGSTSRTHASTRGI